MLDYELLLEKNIINKKNFILDNYHLINLDEVDVLIILMIEFLIENNEFVTINKLEEKMSLSAQKIDARIKRLVEQRYLSIDTYSSKNSINTINVYTKIIEKLNIKEFKHKEEVKKIGDANIIKLLEKEFSRKMTPLEIATIKEWVETYSDELINYAIKESSMRNIKNLKYIETILIEQARVLNG
ncbi:MAG: DnaD domain protein [Erysipelotrichales bacterium]